MPRDDRALRAIVLLLILGMSTLPASARAADGRTIYRQVCAVCHATGVANAPKLGDKAAWASRLSAGRAAMVTSVLKGKGQMPPKGGNVSLSDDDVKAALDYMLGEAR